MKTTIKLGKIDGYGNGRKTCRVTVEVELDDKNVFTASADIWNSRGTGIIRCGQCLDELAQYSSIKNNPKFKQVYEWWKKWHLNDMHAGTEKQEQALEDAGLTGWANEYSNRCDYLESIGLLYDNGYEFGTSWLKREIPDEIQEEMRKFIKEN